MPLAHRSLGRFLSQHHIAGRRPSLDTKHHRATACPNPSSSLMFVEVPILILYRRPVWLPITSKHPRLSNCSRCAGESHSRISFRLRRSGSLAGPASRNHSHNMRKSRQIISISLAVLPIRDFATGEANEIEPPFGSASSSPTMRYFCTRPSVRLKVTVLPKATTSGDEGLGTTRAVRSLSEK